MRPVPPPERRGGPRFGKAPDEDPDRAPDNNLDKDLNIDLDKR